jgi:hypothetical protein
MWQWITNLWNKFIIAFKAFISAVFTQSSQIIIGKLKDVAIQAVQTLMTAELTDYEKRTAAFNQIKAYAVAQGIEAKDSIINLVIELAVQYWKNQ